jgi:hypothetical protein
MQSWGKGIHKTREDPEAHKGNSDEFVIIVKRDFQLKSQ